MSKQYYTYVIIDQKPVDTRRYYIGYRGAKCRPREDIKYMGSCDSLSSEIRRRPDDFKKVILAIHYNKFMAIWHENILQKAFDVVRSPLFYNRSIQTTSGFCYEGVGENNPMYGIKLTGEKNGMYGKSHTYETCIKMREAAKNRPPAKNKGASHYKFRPDITTERIEDLHNQGFTYMQIARILNCNYVTLWDKRKKNA